MSRRSDLVVKEDGKVGIGMAGPTATLEVKVGGTTLADDWTTRSSARLKTNVQTIASALDRVMHLRGVTFDWKDTGRRSVGFIAEEVARVLPEAVAYDTNGREAKGPRAPSAELVGPRAPSSALVGPRAPSAALVGLDYGKLTPLLLEAIKEQQKLIAELKQQNAELQARLITQDARLASVEAAVAAQTGR